jgi:DNA-binding phage protein
MVTKQKKASTSGLLEDFLAEHNIFDQCQHDAIKRTLSLQIERAMSEQNLTKSALAQRMGTSRSALDRLLDPNNESATLETLKRVAEATGQRLLVRLVTNKESTPSSR